MQYLTIAKKEKFNLTKYSKAKGYSENILQITDTRNTYIDIYYIHTYVQMYCNYTDETMYKSTWYIFKSYSN